MRKVTEKSLTNSALYYLKRYSATAGQLAFVLKRKVGRVRRAAEEKAATPEQVTEWIEAVVKKLTGLGYLDDRRFAQSKTTSLRNAGKSTRAIRATLRAKRVPAGLIAEVESGGEEAAAWRFAQKKKLGAFRLGDRQAHRLKDLARMARAGFSFQLARAVIDGSADDAVQPP